ncbi:MAG: hypothetical protein BV456_04655 [Thermoplasmata archaeon M8B2D]|nr:MAG: hypothetical protein BV456_04655 [Thermoplasmata archaeon M8B2D]
MPYGLPKEIGGDSKTNEEWMKKCVSRVMGRKNARTGGKTDKKTAIMICKKTLMKSKGNAALASLLIFELERKGRFSDE